jgi:hypothetical protein
MTRPAIPDILRVILVALGVCCLAFVVFVLWQFRGVGTADGIVAVHPAVDGWGRTNMITVVSFTAPDGTKAVVMASDIPVDLRAGQHFTVVYDRTRWMKDSWLLRDILRIPIAATALGVVLASLGYLRAVGVKWCFRIHLRTRPNNSLHRTAGVRSCCSRCDMSPPSLSFCR